MSEFASTSASIEVYPYEGGSFAIQGGQIMSVIYEKAVSDGNVGQATIVLAPGGPFGPESSPTWTEVLTPMSHVLIGMTRGQSSAIIFDGVLISIDEQQNWQTSDNGSIAGRVITMICADFGYFFKTFNWYALTFLGLSVGAGVGNALGFEPAGIPAQIAQGTLGGYNPAKVAQLWYEKIMVGTPNGILGKTYVPYKNQPAGITIQAAMRSMFEEFPNAKIPVGDFFMATEGSWMDKFIAMLPPPWYEFFITTAPAGAYGLIQGSNADTSPGTQFSMLTQIAAEPAGPVLVARVNPIPILNATATTVQQAAVLGSMDMTRWQNLPRYKLSSFGFISSDIQFSAGEAANFYQINPTALSMIFNNNNANNIPFIYSMMFAADAASVRRYGYKPAIASFRWWWDPQGLAAQSNAVNFPSSIALMLSRYISQVHPLPLMARATVTCNLIPDVLIGTRFQYAPFKDGVLWDFYIETVRHRFVFGGNSTTTLGLSRGLPTDIYSDPSDNGLLRNIYLGNAERFNGNYQVGLPPGASSSLQVYGTQAEIIKAMGQLAGIFVQPQPPTGS